MPDEFTGERVVPGQVDPDLYNEHFSRYAFARRFAEHKQVLDLGCGTGYGTAALAEVADHVTGIDLSPDAVAYAREHFVQHNLFFAVGSATEARPDCFDLITAFEVIEHLKNWRGLLANAHASLTEDGIFLVSTPNKPLYAEARGSAGTNPFHVHEFEYDEFHSALSGVFPHVAMFVQNHSAGILFAQPDARHGFKLNLESGSETHNADPAHAHFFVGLCSRGPLPELSNFFWLASSANLLSDRDRHIALLSDELDLKTHWIAEGRAELAARNREYEELLDLHRDLKTELEARNTWAREQDEQLRERGHRVEELQAEIEASRNEWADAAAAYERHSAELEDANKATTAWALETERELNSRGADLARAVELLDTAERTVEERTLWAQSLERELQSWQNRFTALRRSPWVRAGSRLRLITDRT